MLPTRADTYSWATLEAMAMGLPVIVSEVGGIGDIVIEGKTGFLVRPDDLDALTRRLQTLVEDPRGRREMGMRGRRRVEEQFDLARSTETVMTLLKSISTNGGRRKTSYR